jgi:hypothetical protein
VLAQVDNQTVQQPAEQRATPRGQRSNAPLRRAIETNRKMTIILFGLLLVPPSPPSWEKTQEKRRAKGRTPDHAAVGGQKLPSRRGPRENVETVETIWKPVWNPPLFLRKPWKPYFTLIKLILFNFDKQCPVSTVSNNCLRFPQWFPLVSTGFRIPLGAGKETFFPKAALWLRHANSHPAPREKRGGAIVDSYCSVGLLSYRTH